jgi:hypothetical protein
MPNTNPFDYLAWFKVQVIEPKTREVFYEVNLRGEGTLDVCEAVLKLLCICPNTDNIISRIGHEEEGWRLYSIKDFDILVTAAEDPVDFEGRIELALQIAKDILNPRRDTDKAILRSSLLEMVRALLGGKPKTGEIYEISETIEYGEFMKDLQ